MHRSVCVWACPARCDLAAQLWASGTDAVPGVQPIVTAAAINKHSTLAKQPRTAGMGTLHSLHPASSSQHTFLPHWPGKHCCCCSLSSPSSLMSLTCSTHAAFLSSSLPTEQKCVHGNLPCFALATADCCYTFASNLLPLLIHLDWNGKLVWRCPELFIGSTSQDKSGHEMHLGAEVNVVCEREWCSCGFVGELLSAPAVVRDWVMTIKT